MSPGEMIRRWKCLHSESKLSTCCPMLLTKVWVEINTPALYFHFRLHHLAACYLGDVIPQHCAYSLMKIHNVIIHSRISAPAGVGRNYTELI